jgi:hypothetical protein
MATTPEPSDLLPVHLVESPPRRGLARVGIGTVPFNAAALTLLVAMSAFVVLGSAYVAETVVDDDGDDPTVETAEPPRTGQPADDLLVDPTRAPGGETDPAGVGLPTGGRAPTAVTPVRSTRPASGSEGAGAAPAGAASGPAIPKPFTCDRFTTQPEAQAAYDADPAVGVVLDGDGDGLACEHLPGLEAPPPGPELVLPTADQLLRPATRLYGVHTTEAPFVMREVDAFTASVGKAPNNVMFFSNLSRGFPAGPVDNAWRSGMLPIISFEPIVEGADGQPRMRDITAGVWDDYFREWAAAAAADARPVALRFAHEMNGDWYTWSDGAFGNDHGDYVAAWRHVHDLFEEVGADNVLWIWSVNRIDNLRDKTISRVYPGADYVDWVGMSGYYREATSLPTFNGTFAMTLGALRTVAPGKLVMLTEVGAGTSEANRVEWIESFFAGLLERQEIIGFTWFNDFKSGGDWLVQFSAATTDAFAAGVADPRYGSLVRVAEG